MSNRTVGRRIFPLLFLMNGLIARADYSNTVMSLNPVAYWPLNEAPRTDPGLNQMTNEPDLEFQYCGNITPGVASAIAANTNTAATFDGVTSCLIASFRPALSLPAPFTIEGWFRPASASAACVCSCGGFGARRSGWAVYYDPFHGWNFRLHTKNSPAPSLNIEGGDCSVGAWHHVAAVYNGTNGWLYVDGSLAAGPAAVNDFTPNQSGVFTIGTRSDNSFPFNGSADEVVLYTNALPSSVIETHYETGTNPAPSESYAALIKSQKPLLYWKADEALFRSNVLTTNLTLALATSEAMITNSQLQILKIAFNYGSLGDAANGTYLSGVRPGLRGPPFRGFGPTSFACGFESSFGGYIDCTSNALLNITGPMTAIAWVKATPGVKRFQTFLGRGNSSWRADVDWYGIMRWADGNENPDAIGITMVNDGSWHFFAGVYDGATNSVYVDGKLEGVSRTVYPIAGCQCKTIIGSVGDYLSERQFQGSVAQVAIYTNALAAAEILRLYQSAESSRAAYK
jgi:hypothetical protein